MKKILFSILAIILIGSCNSISNKQDKTTETRVIPRPSGPRKERKKFKKQFFENMHRSEEGFNWKQHNKDLRWENYIQKNSKKQLSVAGYWTERGSANQSGRIHTAELDTLHNILYCASSGGNIWKGTPEGENWVSMNDELRFYDIKMLDMIQNDTLNRLIVCSGSSEFYFTDDEGETWNQSTGLEGTIEWGHIRKAVVVNDSLQSIYVLTSEWDNASWSAVSKIYKSSNQGLSFDFIKKYTVNVDKVDIWAPYQNSDTLYVLSNKNILTLATDQEIPESRSTISSSTTGYSLLTGCVTNNQTRLFAYINHELHRSDDHGNNWYLVSELEQSPFFSMSFNASITNPNHLYFGAVECYASYDGGYTWESINYWADYYDYPETMLHADIPNIKPVLNSQGEELTYISTDGGLYVSNNNLESVQNISLASLNVSQYYSTYTNRNNTSYIYAGSQDQGFQRSSEGNSDSTFNFNQIISGDYGHIVSTDGGSSIWMVYPGFADYYPNAETGESGDSWYFPDNATELWMPPLMADPNFENTAYLAGGSLSDEGSHIIRLEYNNSISSYQLGFDFEAASGGGYITAMASSLINTNYWYVLTNNGKFFSSTDYGVTWSQTEDFEGPENHYFYGASIQPSHIELGKVYISGSGYSNPGVYMTENNGESFIALDEGLPSTMIYDIASTYGDEYLFAATELGPYVYSSEENSWELMSDVAPDQIYWSVEFIDELKTARFGTYGRGIWDFKLEEPTSSISLTEHAENSLHVYPNPTKNTLNIHIGNLQNSQIEIYNINGELLHQKESYTGNLVQIDVTNYQAGTYICKIKNNLTQKNITFIKN